MDDIHENNKANSRWKAPFPLSENAIKRKAKKVSDPAAMQSTAYIQVSDNDIQAWQQKVQQSTKPPTDEQNAFLQAIIDRCKVEKNEFHRWVGAHCQN